jgi:hypothetical protein
MDRQVGSEHNDLTVLGNLNVHRQHYDTTTSRVGSVRGRNTA